MVAVRAISPSPSSRGGKAAARLNGNAECGTNTDERHTMCRLPTHTYGTYERFIQRSIPALSEVLTGRMAAARLPSTGQK